jgi:hypothetical protein
LPTNQAPKPPTASPAPTDADERTDTAGGTGEDDHGPHRSEDDGGVVGCDREVRGCGLHLLTLVGTDVGHLLRLSLEPPGKAKVGARLGQIMG